jgi:hypothetical protein
MTCSEILTLALTLALVLTTAIYAWLTYRILKANERSVQAIREQSAQQTRLEAYDRRLRVYDSINRFIAEILQRGTTDDERLTEMLRETKHAKFLLPVDDDLTGYIDSLYNKGLDLQYKEGEIRADRQVCTQERRERLIEESRVLKDWFKTQFEVVDTKFRKHLQL